jgi:hypothetical protein
MPATAIIVFSDPRAGEEALGRVFNALILTQSLKEKGEDVSLAFQGAGSRWPGELSKPLHPANALYGAVRDTVVGVSEACAVVFGASESVKEAGLPLLHDRPVAGTPGVFDLSPWLAEGRRLVTF